jgi:hypothetical protein
VPIQVQVADVGAFLPSYEQKILDFFSFLSHEPAWASSSKDPISKITRAKWTGGAAQASHLVPWPAIFSLFDDKLINLCFLLKTKPKANKQA